MNNDRRKSPLINVVIYSTILILIFFGLEYLRDFVPPNLYENEVSSINTIGLFIIIGTLFYCIAVTKEINQSYSNLSEIKIALLSSFAFIATELLFKVTQAVFLGFENAFYYYNPIYMISHCGILGFAISFMTINKIRDYDIQKLIVIYIVLFVGLGFIIKYFN